MGPEKALEGVGRFVARSNLEKRMHPARHPAQQVTQRHPQHLVQTEEEGQVGAQRSADSGVVSEGAPGSLVPVVVVHTLQQGLKPEVRLLAADVRTLIAIRQAVLAGLVRLDQLTAMLVSLLVQKTIGPVSEVAVVAGEAKRLALL